MMILIINACVILLPFERFHYHEKDLNFKIVIFWLIKFLSRPLCYKPNKMMAQYVQCTRGFELPSDKSNMEARKCFNVCITQMQIPPHVPLLIKNIQYSVRPSIVYIFMFSCKTIIPCVRP